MALLQPRSDLDIFPGYPNLDALKQLLPVVARSLRDSFRGYVAPERLCFKGPLRQKMFVPPRIADEEVFAVYIGNLFFWRTSPQDPSHIW